VVHGPLLATMLLDLVARNRPASRVTTFSFRALAPLFAGDVISLNAAPDPGGRLVRLWAVGKERGLAMEAEAIMVTV
ncbi:MAG: acyl-CoA dehydrogenase, partial [Acetobacteraceae bacterium]